MCSLCFISLLVNDFHLSFLATTPSVSSLALLKWDEQVSVHIIKSYFFAYKWLLEVSVISSGCNVCNYLTSSNNSFFLFFLSRFIWIFLRRGVLLTTIPMLSRTISKFNCVLKFLIGHFPLLSLWWPQHWLPDLIWAALLLVHDPKLSNEVWETFLVKLLKYHTELNRNKFNNLQLYFRQTHNCMHFRRNEESFMQIASTA